MTINREKLWVEERYDCDGCGDRFYKHELTKHTFTKWIDRIKYGRVRLCAACYKRSKE